MSWHIHLVTNTVKISDACADSVLSCGMDLGALKAREEVVYKGKLIFYPDHMEHMDYVSEKKVQKVLKAHKVKGDICFASEEGDDAGASWGYRFDGKGGMVHLKGERVFVEVAPKASHKPKPKATRKRAG